MIAFILLLIALSTTYAQLISCDEPRFDVLTVHSPTVMDLGYVITNIDSTDYNLTLSPAINDTTIYVNITLDHIGVIPATFTLSLNNVSTHIIYTDNGHGNLVQLFDFSPLSYINTVSVYINQSRVVGNLESDNCYWIYTFDIYNPLDLNGSVIGDPQFVGLHGQRFSVKGIPGGVYNIITQTDFQMNARFKFMSKPIDNSTCNKSNSVVCWSHAGTYIEEIGIMANNRVYYLLAGTIIDGFQGYDINGYKAQISLNRVIINVNNGQWFIHIENNDGFLNVLNVTLKKFTQAHGLIGQTYRMNQHMYEGIVDDYYITDNNLFGIDFVYNKFQPSTIDWLQDNPILGEYESIAVID